MGSFLSCNNSSAKFGSFVSYPLYLQHSSEGGNKKKSNNNTKLEYM